MKSKSIKNCSNQSQLPKLLGKREKTPLKSNEKSFYNNCMNIRNSTDVPDFNKYVLTTECIVENTIESTNNGELKKIFKSSTDIPSKLNQICRTNQQRREKIHRDPNGVHWTSF